MVIKDKFRFTSFILFIIMFIVIIFLSIKAYGSSETVENTHKELGIGDYISKLSTSISTVDDTNSYEEEDMYVNYKQVQITQGENLWDIAKRYHTKGDVRKYVRHVAQINNLSEGTVMQNQVIMVPISN